MKAPNSYIAVSTEQKIQELFNCISNKHSKEFKSSIRNYLKDNNEPIWNFRETNDFTILHKIATKDVDFDNPNEFDIVEEIFDYIESNSSNEILVNFINCKTSKGLTAIHYASLKGNIYLMNLIRRKGGKINSYNKKGIKIMHMASQGTQVSSIIFLNEYWNLCAESPDAEGSTPLHWSCYFGNENIVSYLLLCKTRPKKEETEIIKENKSISSINSSLINSSSDYLSINEEDKKEININPQDNKGITPLHLAALNGNDRIVRLLLQYGANKDIKDTSGENGKTPYDLAKIKNKKKVIKILEKSHPCLGNIFRVKAPLEKVKKSKKNIYLFFGISCFILIMSIFIMFIQIEKKEFVQKTFMFIFFSFFGMTLLLYNLLLFGFNSFRERTENEPTLKERIEKTLELKMNCYLGDYCPKCKLKRNILDKHCFICNRCIDDFDHHCYWINKCIGKNNYKFFISFLLLTFITLGYSIFIYLKFIFKVVSHEKYSIFGHNIKIIFLYIIFIILLFLCIFLEIPLFFLVLIQIRNIWFNCKNKEVIRRNYNRNISSVSII